MRITGLRRRSRRKLGAAVRGVGEVGGRRRVWHNGRRDWAGRTSEWPSATQARKPDVVPVRELPYWPAAMALLIEAGQMTAYDYVPIYPDLPLASEGASTDAVQAVGGVSHMGLPPFPRPVWKSRCRLGLGLSPKGSDAAHHSESF